MNTTEIDKRDLLKRLIGDLEERINKLKHFDSDEEVNAHFDDLEIEVIQTVESAIQHLNQVQAVLLDKINAQRTIILDRETAPLRNYRIDESLEQYIESLSNDLKEFQEQRLVSSANSFDIEESISVFTQKSCFYKDQISKLRMELKKQAFKGRFMKFKKSEWFFMKDNILGSLEPCEIDINNAKIETKVTLTKQAEFKYQSLPLPPTFLTNGSLYVPVKDAMQIWNKKSNTMENLPIVTDKFILSLLDLPGGFWAAGTSLGQILFVDAVNANIFSASQAHSGPIWVLQLLPNHSLLSFSYEDRSIKVWQIGLNFELTLLINIACAHGMRRFVTLHDSVVAFQNIDQHFNIRFWGLNDGLLLKEVKIKSNYVSCTCFLPCDRVAICTYEHGIKILNIHDASESNFIKVNELISTLARLSSGHLVAGSGNNFSIFDPNTGECLQIVPIFENSHANIMRICVSIDGNYLCVTSEDKKVAVLALSFSR